MEKKKYKRKPKPFHYVVYGHEDPFTGYLRYIGKSIRGLTRARDHFRPSAIKTRENPHHAAWIKSCIERGKRPIPVIIEEFDSEEPLNEAERFWIAAVRATGAVLLNVLDGGDTPPRTINTPEMIAALVARNHARVYPRGYKLSEEHRAAIGRGGLGQKKRLKTEEEKTAMAFKKGGRPFTDQYDNLYYNINALARQIGCNRSSIQNVLSGSRPTVKGLKLKYVNETERKEIG